MKGVEALVSVDPDLLVLSIGDNNRGDEEDIF